MGRKPASVVAAEAAMPAVEQSGAPLVHLGVAKILQEVQLPTGQLRSACVAMLKEQRAMGTPAFVDAFSQLVGRVICVKKKEPAVEKVIKFIVAYCKHLSDKGAGIASRDAG